VPDDRRDASDFTKAVNDELLSRLPFEDRQDFEDAARGHVADLGGAVTKTADGRVVWDPDKFAFIGEDAPAPATVNPSLWRQSQLCAKGGLFKVVDRLYQVRNHDISNLTIVEGDTGLILFDPLISPECSEAALALYFEHRPRRPVVAVVYSHSHVDHYGGVKGVISEEDVAAGRVRVIAPEGFLEAAVSENVLAGNVMTRRALYQYGSLIPFDEKGNVGLGLGMAVSLGAIGLIAPTETIAETGQKLDVDGLTFEFMLAPDTEAPSEMHWFIEELGALTAAENCCHTLHNTYTLRGAQIRDPHAWSQYLGETIERASTCSSTTSPCASTARRPGAGATSRSTGSSPTPARRCCCGSPTVRSATSSAASTSTPTRRSRSRAVRSTASSSARRRSTRRRRPARSRSSRTSRRSTRCSGCWTSSACGST
jgi:alkyl sulfatase BDS1-like metallo-beta-lactamase superfamily hydrolase